MWSTFREQQKVLLSCGLITAGVAVVIVELVMPVMFDMTLSAFGGLTFVVVEFLAALIVDLPLAGVCGFLVARFAPASRERHGLVAGLVFFGLLLLFVVLFVAINQLVPFSAMFHSITPVIERAREELGLKVPVFIVLFLLFDALACSLFSTAGWRIGRLIRGGSEEDAEPR